MVAGKEVLASVRTRAEVRGTTVYASDSLPLGVAGVSAKWGSHGRNVHVMSVAIVLKSPPRGGQIQSAHPSHPGDWLDQNGVSG